MGGFSNATGAAEKLPEIGLIEQHNRGTPFVCSSSLPE
jgi:hypothetical protein